MGTRIDWLSPLFCLVLTSCAFFQGYPRPEHASAEEASTIQFPLVMPEEGRQRIQGDTFRAVQLTMDDFLPWDTRPARDADEQQKCLLQRESYDVFTTPGPEGVMFVSVLPNPERCDLGGPPSEVSATYAIDVRGWRILAVRQ